MNKGTILIAELDPVLRGNWKSVLIRQGFEVLESADKIKALQTFEARNLDLVILGCFRSESGDALEVAHQIRRCNKGIPLILVAAKSSEELAITALRAGINDYLKAPISTDQLAAVVMRCLSDCGPAACSAKATTSSDELIEGHRMVGRSGFVQEVKGVIAEVALTATSVLISGETGTGKELVAELIHRNSPRHQKPFVCVNCAAIPDSLLESELFGHERGSYTGAHGLYEGKLKLAEGGTVFLDEIGDLSSYAQAKMLRFIESKETQRLGARENLRLNVRIITATNQDLAVLAEDGNFRKDLYFRLNVARIHLAPLRNRQQDIPHLVAHYIREFNRLLGRQVEGFTAEALEALTNYDWPGNIRELKNLLEATFISTRARQISLMDLPEHFREKVKHRPVSSSAEVKQLVSTLRSTNWNKSQAARKLNWSRMTLYRKMAKYHIAGAGSCS